MIKINKAIKIGIVFSFFSLVYYSVCAQSTDFIKRYGDYGYWKSEVASDFTAFRKIDSLLILKDSIQIIKIEIGGDYSLELHFERFYCNNMEWKYNSNTKKVRKVDFQELSKVCLDLNDKTFQQHENYILFPEKQSGSHRTIAYFVVYNGKIVKSLTTSIRIVDIPSNILSNDNIFFVFKEKRNTTHRLD